MNCVALVDSWFLGYKRGYKVWFNYGTIHSYLNELRLKGFVWFVERRRSLWIAILFVDYCHIMQEWRTMYNRWTLKETLLDSLCRRIWNISISSSTVDRISKLNRVDGKAFVIECYTPKEKSVSHLKNRWWAFLCPF